MYKRMSIRVVTDLSNDLTAIARKRGLSVNSLISEMAWDFVEDWKMRHGGSDIHREQYISVNPKEINGENKEE